MTKQVKYAALGIGAVALITAIVRCVLDALGGK